MSLKDKYAIVGAAATRFGRLPGSTTVGLTVEAAKLAIEDSGIDKSEIDCVLTKFPRTGFVNLYAHRIAQHLGIVPTIAAEIDNAGATNATLVQYAAMAIDAGMIKTAVCCYGDNPVTAARGTYEGSRGNSAAYGLFGAAAGYAMITLRHMHEFGTTSRQLGVVAVSTRKWASLNPNAQMRTPITIEDHQNSRWVAWPLHLLDCCLVSDGGAAVVVTSAERARSLKQPPVYVMGMGQMHIAWELTHRPMLTEAGGRQSGELAFRMAEITPKDVDVAQIYDCFTITPIMTLEDYGFCGKGEGGAFVEDGRIEPGGELPMNTSGGLLSESGMAGMQLIVEAVRQLRGECGERQVKDAEIACVSLQGGIMHTHSTLILRR
jgi:acetyl-CoA acetyltransferase